MKGPTAQKYLKLNSTKLTLRVSEICIGYSFLNILTVLFNYTHRLYSHNLKSMKETITYVISQHFEKYCKGIGTTGNRVQKQRSSEQ